MSEYVLVTGGAGYIGSHTVVELLNNNYNILILDNLCNSNRGVVNLIHRLTARQPVFIEGDIRDSTILEDIFNKYKINSIIHFAGLKSVNESVSIPQEYYDVNVVGTINLVNIASKFNVNRIVFSSSATVYGIPEISPISEDSKLEPINPYGNTKYIIEKFLRDYSFSNKNAEITILRYFNPVGAHESGYIGERPKGKPNNLFPFISQVISGDLNCLNIFGGDYNTPDGTAIRDFIHVKDLANGHVNALKHSLAERFNVFNLGTGKGYTVLEVLRMFESIIGRPINHQITSRREGDVESCVADPARANINLGWKAKLNLHQMCGDALRWEMFRKKGVGID